MLQHNGFYTGIVKCSLVYYILLSYMYILIMWSEKFIGNLLASFQA